VERQYSKNLRRIIQYIILLQQMRTIWQVNVNGQLQSTKMYH